MRLFLFALLAALPAMSANAQVLSKNEQKRLEELKADLHTTDPRRYCKAALSLKSEGFFPYCAPFYSSDQDFNLAEVLSVRNYTAPLVAMNGRFVHSDASDLEGALVDEAFKVEGRGCLGHTAAECISHLSKRFIVLTDQSSPFHHHRSQATSFKEEMKNFKQLKLRIALPENFTPYLDKSAYPKDHRFGLVAVEASFTDSLIRSISFSGKYPITTDDSAVHSASGFYEFISEIFPACATIGRDNFYRNYWETLIRSRKFGDDNGRWKSTSWGVSKSHTASSNGQLCGLDVDKLDISGQSLDEHGRRSYGSSTITFRLSR